jgi:hypothetical protein
LALWDFGWESTGASVLGAGPDADDPPHPVVKMEIPNAAIPASNNDLI